MKNRAVIILFFLNIGILFSQPQSGLLVSFALENDSLYAFDPWQVKVAITNISPNPIKCFPLSSEFGIINRVGDIHIEILSNRDSIWHSTNQIKNRADHYACTRFSLEPNHFLVDIGPNDSITAIPSTPLNLSM